MSDLPVIVWSRTRGGLKYLDMLQGDVMTLPDGGTPTRSHVGDAVAAIRPIRGGGLITATGRGVTVFRPDGSETRMPDLWSDQAIRMNEGGCEPDGHFYCRSMAYDETPMPAGSTGLTMTGPSRPWPPA